ncbi:hypothetical protein AJR17_010830, partial [Shigella boydii]
ANELAKNLKTPEDLSQFDRLLKKISVEAALKTTIRQVVVIKLFGARCSINSHFIFLKVNRNNPVSSQII